MALYRRGRIWWVDFYANGTRVQESTRRTSAKQRSITLCVCRK